jgi:hypothetical protein
VHCFSNSSFPESAQAGQAAVSSNSRARDQRRVVDAWGMGDSPSFGKAGWAMGKLHYTGLLQD